MNRTGKMAGPLFQYPLLLATLLPFAAVAMPRVSPVLALVTALSLARYWVDMFLWRFCTPKRRQWLAAGYRSSPRPPPPTTGSPPPSTERQATARCS